MYAVRANMSSVIVMTVWEAHDKYKDMWTLQADWKVEQEMWELWVLVTSTHKYSELWFLSEWLVYLYSLFQDKSFALFPHDFECYEYILP